MAITSPAPGSVSISENIEGTAAHISSSQRLWLVVLPKSQNRYHPQPGPIEASSDGTWNATAYFGDPNTAQGTQFTLMLVVADLRASAEFDRYINNANAVKNYPGMGSLPTGVRSVAKLKYVRQ